MKIYIILFIVLEGQALGLKAQQVVPAEFQASSNTIPQIRLTSNNGQELNEISTNNDGDFVIFMNGVVTEDRFRILDQNGFVGINNSNPQRQLDVTGNANISSFLFSNRARIGNNTDGNSWQLGVQGDQINREGKLFLTNKMNPSGPDDMGLTLENNVGTNRWSVYLNELLSDLDFAFNNDIKSFIRDTDGTYNVLSDKRLKKNISVLNPVLNEVMQLNAMKYKYKDNKETDPFTIGFIAQEVNALFPEIVSSDRDYMALNYSAFGVLAIQAIQEQQELINKQEKEIGLLSKTLVKTNTRIDELESMIQHLVTKR